MLIYWIIATKMRNYR